jgi:hypothetical protein
VPYICGTPENKEHKRHPYTHHLAINKYHHLNGFTKTTTEPETIYRRYSPQSIERTPKIKPHTWAKELVPDLESKVIGAPPKINIGQ